MSGGPRDWDAKCKVYVGNLGNNGNKYDIESAFSKYGPLKNVWVARNPPGFAFVEYEGRYYDLLFLRFEILLRCVKTGVKFLLNEN